MGIRILLGAYTLCNIFIDWILQGCERGTRIDRSIEHHVGRFIPYCNSSYVDFERWAAKNNMQEKIRWTWSAEKCKSRCTYCVLCWWWMQLLVDPSCLCLQCWFYQDHHLQSTWRRIELHHLEMHQPVLSPHLQNYTGNQSITIQA